LVFALIRFIGWEGVGIRPPDWVKSRGCFGASEEGSAKADDRENNPTDEHPDGFIGGCSGKEVGNIRTEGVGGADSKNDQDDTSDQEGKGQYLVHKDVPVLDPPATAEEGEGDNDDSRDKENMKSAAGGGAGD
jgi:hypothetical protein